MITHYENESSCSAWRAAIEAMRLDDGECIEYRLPTPPAAPLPVQAAA